MKKENVCSNVVATTLTKKKTVSEEQSSICEEFWMEENEKNKGENYGEGKRKNIFFRKFVGDKKFYLMVLSIAVPIMIQNGITNFCQSFG